MRYLLCLLLTGCSFLDATGPKSTWHYVVGQPCVLHVTVTTNDGQKGDVFRAYQSCPDTTGYGAMGWHYRIGQH